MLAIALCALNPCLCLAAAANPAEAFVQQNVDRVYAILNNASLTGEQRRARFRDFMLSLTDPDRIGAFTLGQYVNRASKADVEAFDSAFTDYVVAVYESRLSRYKGRTIRITGSTERAADDVVVSAIVVNPENPSAPPTKAAFRVRKSNEGRSIVTDIQVEGIWLALSERSDFTAFLQQHGGRISDLVADMRRRTQALVPATSK
jgi:phospholipid transport system substrate-binding protein